MGLSKTRERTGEWLKVKHGALVKESKEPREGYEEIVVNNPKTNEDIIKFVEKFQALEGVITRIEWYDTEDQYSERYMGIKIKVVDQEDGTAYFLDLPYGKRPYTIFTKVMENIEFQEPVEFNAWLDRKTDKTAFVVRQMGHPIPWKYTKDNLGECPAARALKPSGWDFSAQNEYLYEILVNVIIPKVEALNPDELKFDKEPMPDDEDDVVESEERKQRKAKVKGPDEKEGF